MIFLPGDKIGSDNHPGFGWAPTSLIKVETPELYDFPKASNEVTDLIPGEGLLVTLPGILLHISSQASRHQVLSTDAPDTFYFPVEGNGLIEWFSLTSASDGDVDFLRETNQRRSQLAIIVPNKTIPETLTSIALLVEVYEDGHTQKHPEASKVSLEVIHKCQIVRRVSIRREQTSAIFSGSRICHMPAPASEPLTQISGSSTTTALRSPSRSAVSYISEAQACFGEWTSSEQKWTVDGFKPSRSIILLSDMTAPPLTDKPQNVIKINDTSTRRRGALAGTTYETSKTNSQSQYPSSPLEKALIYWKGLAGRINSSRLSRKSRTPDLGARLIDVSLLKDPSAHGSWDLREDMESLEVGSQTSLSSFSSSVGSTPLWSESGAQFASTPSVLSSRASFTSLVDAADLAVQDLIILFSTHSRVKAQIIRSPPEDITNSLHKLVQFYCVVLWYSASEAWESELALRVEANVPQICEGIISQVYEGAPSGNPRLQTGLTSESRMQPDIRIKQFLLGGAAFDDFLKSLNFATSEQKLHLAVQLQDEDAIQKLTPTKVQNTSKDDATGTTPMDLAVLRVHFLLTTGAPKPMISRALVIIKRLKQTWPLSQLTVVPSPSIVEAAAQISNSATVPDDSSGTNDNFWDIVSGLSVYLPVCSPLELEFTGHIYSWEVPDLIFEIDSTKTRRDHQPTERPSLWDPLQIFSELASVVTVTGSADNFELDSCGALLHTLWGNVGLDALRLIAAGAFLGIVSRAIYARTKCAPSFEELNEYTIHILESQIPAAKSRQTKQKESAEEMVLDILFGEKAGSILSDCGGKAIFPLSMISPSVLIIQYPFKNDDLLEALAWSCTALRPNSSVRPVPGGCSTRLSQGSFHTIAVDGIPPLKFLIWALRPIQDMSLEDVGTHHCWTALFKPGLVVPHKIDRPWGKGLGMTFGMMAHLCASQTFIWLEDESLPQETFAGGRNEAADPDRIPVVQSGGYILGGYRTALIPMSATQDGTRIQWHLETSQDPSTIMDHTALESVTGDWLKVQDVAKFGGSTCYVGWYEKAEVLLGTTSLCQIPEWSGANQHHRSLHAASLNVNAALGLGPAALSPLSAQLSFGTTFNFVSNIQAFDPSTEYNLAIQSDHGKTALVVDYAEKRAYLVPKLSLVLHLCRVEALRSRPKSAGNVQKPCPVVPAAAPSVDGSQAAMDVLRENAEAILIGSENTADKTTLRQLVLQVHFELVKAAGLRESPKRVSLLGSKVFATELRGLLDRPDTGTPLSMIQDPRLLAWVRLAALADAVCICSGLGTAIRPVAVGNVPNCECYELPHDRYLLAAHMKCLQHILERQRCVMSELSLRGELDFGEGYKMRLKCGRLWTQGRHHKHKNFWENRTELIQFIDKEDGVDGRIRELLGTNGKAGQPAAEDPALTGVMVFGIRRQCY